jgi:hypothetical protein
LVTAVVASLAEAEGKAGGVTSAEEEGASSLKESVVCCVLAFCDFWEAVERNSGAASASAVKDSFGTTGAEVAFSSASFFLAVLFLSSSSVKAFTASALAFTGEDLVRFAVAVEVDTETTTVAAVEAGPDSDSDSEAEPAAGARAELTAEASSPSEATTVFLIEPRGDFTGLSSNIT